jgi:hypothetical protein
MARCGCPCGCRAEAVRKTREEDWLSCDACYDVGWGTGSLKICGRRTENFTRCHICHEPISWDAGERKSPDDEEGEPPNDGKQEPLQEKEKYVHSVYGACACGPAAWEYEIAYVGASYNYWPCNETEKPRQETEPYQYLAEHTGRRHERGNNGTRCGTTLSNQACASD